MPCGTARPPSSSIRPKRLRWRAAAAHGQGVGRALLAALIDECERRDFRLMVAVIGARASSGSIKLHEALGFEHVGALEPVGYKHGRWLATVLMQRVLGPGASAP